MGVVVGCVAGALAIGLATLGFFLRRRRQAAKTKDATDPPVPPPNGGDNLEQGRGGRDQQQQDISSSIRLAAARGNGAGGSTPPPAQQSSAPPHRASPPAYQDVVVAYRPKAPPTPPTADRQRVSGAKQLVAVPPLTSTNSTTDASTEERTDEQHDGFGFSAEEGVDAAPATGGRRKTSSGVEYGQAVLAAAQELAHHCQIPGVSEAATAVSILINLVMDSRDLLSRGDAAAKRCRSILIMLERAAKVLGKVSNSNSDTSRPFVFCFHHDARCCRLLRGLKLWLFEAGFLL